MMPRKPIVVVVDDDPGTTESLALALEAEGYHAPTAQDGVEAIELVNARRPHAIISNLLLPRLDGWNVCEFLRSQPALQNVPVVLLTETFGPATQSRAWLLGALLVAKPCDPRILAALLGEVLRAPIEGAHRH
jgi:DNA-binding response OmpR family regulator